MLPLAGGLLFAALIAVWYTSALWLYRHDSSPAPATKASPIPADANVTAGKVVYASAGCGGCHTLKAAGSSGQAGPNLDALRPGFEQVQRQVERGGGGMPAFGGRLSEIQIRDVAAFVAARAGSG